MNFVYLLVTPLRCEGRISEDSSYGTRRGRGVSGDSMREVGKRHDIESAHTGTFFLTEYPNKYYVVRR